MPGPLVAHFGVFLVLVALLTLTPGADTAFVTAVTLRSGRRAAFRASLGINAGLLVHATASAVGLSLILARSAAAFTALKLVGAAYLVFLGVRAWIASGKQRAPAPVAGGLARVRGGGDPLAQGFLTNVLNPKVALFYLTFLPQFIEPGDPVLLISLGLAAIHMLMGLVQLNSVSWLVSRAAARLNEGRFRRLMERATGTAMIAFGVRLAFAERPT